MKTLNSLSMALVLAAVVTGVAPREALAQQPSTSTVYATGLEAPRGLKFGPDGFLYVAEAGTGGTNSTAGTCEQVPPPVGPYTGGKTARISRVNKDGTLTTVASGFPSAQNALGDRIGVADVAFAGGSLYALLAAGGCGHGNQDISSGIARVDLNTGQWNLIADIGTFLKTHPAKYVSAEDFEPEGTLYSMINTRGILVTVEPNHGQVFAVTPQGRIWEVIDISASEGHIVPTSIAERQGSLYIGNLNLFPIHPQSARVLTVGLRFFDEDPAPGFGKGGVRFRIVGSKAGFTTVVAVEFGPDGLLYALELSDAPGFPMPGQGKVVRVKSSGDIEEVVTGLDVPTGMTFGPDGRLYISNFGAAPVSAPPGSGQILQFDIAPGS
jgi:hypothetical protein